MAYPEQSLAKRLLENDPEVLGQVFRWISTALTATPFWALRPEWADLAQDVLLHVVESLRLERFDGGRDFRAYVQGIARHVSLQALSRAQTARSRDALSAPGAAPKSPEADVIDRQLVRRSLDGVPAECRDLFRLYFFEGRDYKEIAGSLGIPIGTVKSRIFRCLECAHAAVLDGSSRNRHGVRSFRAPLEYVSRGRA